MIRYAVSDGVCVLTLDSPPVNTITLETLDELVAAVARANDDTAVRGVVITGAPPHFSAGVDVNLLGDVRTAGDAAAFSRAFHAAYQAVEDSPKPFVAAMSGRVIGGALELAAACHARAAAPGASFSMPEINLAISPGAGGPTRLPRLIGVEATLDMLLTGRRVLADEALALGLVDAVDEDPVAAAAALFALDRPPTCLRTDRLQSPDFSAAEAVVKNTRPEIIAAAKMFEIVKTGIDDVEAGFLAEQRAFGECVDTLATQNKIRLFLATPQTGKVAELADVRPAEIAKVAVVGMGSMGTGIAHALIIAGVPVVASDEDETALQRGAERIQRSVQKRVDQDKMAPARAEAMLALLTTTTDGAGIADADLVIEAVFEHVETKRAVIARIEETCPSSAVIATNTSTISLDALAEGMQRPERLVGMHFFNPAHRMPLVEVIRRDGTAPAVLATALAFAKSIRKTPVLVRNREGFLVNRVFLPYLKEAFWLLEDGAAAPHVDAAMVEFGFPMGPLVLIDMAGLDILAHTDRVMSRAFPTHGTLSDVAERLVEQGRCGQKTGAGVYRYEPGDYTAYSDGVTERIIQEVQKQTGRTPRDVGRDEITDRLVLRMVAEAFRVLEEGICQGESDLDVAMVLGTGFPDFRGGVVRYAHNLGLDRVCARLQALERQFGERFAPPRLLQQMKGTD
jgi:3-hydroxyacyl-CoA dehydrogenase